MVANPGSYVVPISATNAAGTGNANLMVIASVTPPPPPGPIPGGVKLTLTGDLPAGDYEVHKAGTQAKIDSMLEVIQWFRGKEATSKEPPLLGKVEQADKDARIQQLERERDATAKELANVLKEFRQMQKDYLPKK